MHLLWASLAIPVLIHLVHRRKAKRVPFSTLRFLQMVDLRVARRQRLKELLLLALRLLLLAVLIAALYRPLIRSATFKGTDVPTAVAVVLDNTYSMRAAAGRTLRFAHAKEAADDVLEGLQTGDCAAIVLLDAQEDTPPEPTTDLNSLRQSLAGLECGYGTAELAGAVRRALEGLDQSTLPRKELYVVTDFQRLCWTPALAELQDAFPPDLSVFLVDVGTEVGSNLALTSAEFGVNVQVAGAAAELYCGLRNFGRRHVEKQLSLSLNGEKVAHRDVALAPGAEMVASFSHVFGRTGEFAGEVSLESDELDADNARHFTVTVLDKLVVLLVNGDPSAVPYLNETFFLELALGAPAAGGKTVSPVQTKTVTPAEFLDQRLDDYGCVVLANVPAPTELWMDRLRRYVLGGGGLIVFAGDRVDSPAYNAAFSGSQEEVLLPALLGEVRDSTASGAEGGFRIRGLDRQHPVFRSLAEAMDTHAARVKRFLATTPHAEGGGSALADLDAGPLFLEQKAGGGTVILCTSAADLDWSNLAARSFFLPVLHQMVYYVSRSATRGHSVTVGMPYTLELPPSDAPVEVKVFGPQQQSPAGAAASPGAEREGEEEPLAVLADEGAHKATFRATQRPGTYRAVYTIGNQEHRHLFAVNVESRESELDRIEPQEAQRVLGAPNSKVVSDPERLASLVRREREGLPLWNHLFVLAILLAVAESFVGNAVLKH